MSGATLEISLGVGTIALFRIAGSMNLAPAGFGDDALRRKFNKNAIFAIYYACTTLCAIAIAVLTRFDVTEMAQEFSAHSPAEVPFLCFYGVQLGFYAVLVYDALVPDGTMVDRGRLLFHHILTFGLLALSLYCGYWRVGFLVLLLHDASDVLLYSAKTAQYYFRATGRMESLVTLLFALFVAGFVVARIILFPLLVIRPCALAPDAVCDFAVDPYIAEKPVVVGLWGGWFWATPLLLAGAPNPFCFKLSLACLYGLCALFVLQLTWLANIVAQVRKIQHQGIAAEDVRDDDEKDEKDPATPSKPPKRVRFKDE